MLERLEAVILPWKKMAETILFAKKKGFQNHRSHSYHDIHTYRDVFFKQQYWAQGSDMKGWWSFFGCGCR